MTNKEAIERHLMAQSNAIRHERKTRSEAARMRFEAIVFIATLATCIATIVVVRASNARLENDLTLAQVPATTETQLPSFIAPVHPSPKAGALFTLDATTYGDEYEGRMTASGARFRQSEATVASNVHPFGTKLKITYGNRSVIGTVTDRLNKRYSHRIDLSRSLWDQLTDSAEPGIAHRCKVEELK